MPPSILARGKNLDAGRVYFARTDKINRVEPPKAAEPKKDWHDVKSCPSFATTGQNRYLTLASLVRRRGQPSGEAQ